MNPKGGANTCRVIQPRSLKASQLRMRLTFRASLLQWLIIFAGIGLLFLRLAVSVVGVFSGSFHLATSS